MYTHIQGTFAAIYFEGDVPSCYLLEYKQRQGNPYECAYLWDKFPLSKKLVSFALWTIVIPQLSTEAYNVPV